MKELLNTEEAAALLGIRPATLIKWRHQNSGPTYVKLGRNVRYEPDTLERWVKLRRAQ
jgi:excisionase family DNA binding protein